MTTDEAKAVLREAFPTAKKVAIEGCYFATKIGVGIDMGVRRHAVLIETLDSLPQAISALREWADQDQRCDSVDTAAG